MSDDTSTVNVTDESARVLSARTRRTFAADWALFTDRCAATVTTALPADPRTVVDFLTGCAAAPATLRCRHRPPPQRLRPPAAGGVRGGAGRAGPAHRRTFRPHGQGQGCGRRGAARAALARLDPGLRLPGRRCGRFAGTGGAGLGRVAGRGAVSQATRS